MKKKNYEKIHETVLRDVLDIMDGILDLTDGDIEDLVKKYRNKRPIKSIARVSNDLICVFPVLSSRTIAIENQSIVCKAHEKNCVSMLQMIFSAAQLTDATDAFEYIQQFHTNINKTAKLFDIDDVLMVSDSLNEDALIKEGYKPDGTVLRMLKEDMKNLGYTLEPDLNPRSISESFTCRLDATGKYAIEIKPMIKINEGRKEQKRINHLERELKRTNDENEDLIWQINDLRNAEQELERKQAELQNEINSKDSEISKLTMDQIDSDKINIDKSEEIKRLNSEKKELEQEKKSLEADKKKLETDIKQKQQDDAEMLALNKAEKRSNIERNDHANQKVISDMLKNNMDYYAKQVLNTEYKKANELQPTLMVVNFKSKIGDRYESVQSVIIGVKAKLYPIESEDIITHIVSKTKDSNWVQKLIKASTREISFFRDFLFAIDKAKVDALSMSRRGSANKMWKVLERRAFKSRFNRLLARKNDATAITTLMISENEADFIRKQFQIDVNDVSIARNLLEKYNLLAICIVDESLELAKFLYDTGEDMWETLAFSSLEKESNDNTYKKVVNLMTKIV